MPVLRESQYHHKPIADARANNLTTGTAIANIPGSGTAACSSTRSRERLLHRQVVRPLVVQPDLAVRVRRVVQASSSAPVHRHRVRVARHGDRQRVNPSPREDAVPPPPTGWSNPIDHAVDSTGSSRRSRRGCPGRTRCPEDQQNPVGVRPVRPQPDPPSASAVTSTETVVNPSMSQRQRRDRHRRVRRRGSRSSGRVVATQFPKRCSPGQCSPRCSKAATAAGAKLCR